MGMEVVIHLRVSVRKETQRIKSQFFFPVHYVKVIFNLLAFYTKTFCLFNGWNGNFEIKKPIKMYLYKS